MATESSVRLLEPYRGLEKIHVESLGYRVVDVNAKHQYESSFSPKNIDFKEESINENTNVANVLLTEMNKTDQNMLVQTHTFEKTYQELKMATECSVWPLEPYRGREKTPGNLSRSEEHTSELQSQ